MTIEQTISEPQRAILKSTKAMNLFLGGVGCFHGETLIPTDKGYKQIRDIESGDRVLSFNETLQKTEYKSVVQKYCYKTGDIKQKCSIFVVNNHKIICTNEHRFYFKGTWVAIRELAQRSLESNTGNKGQVLREQYGKAINPKVARGILSGDNEACVGCLRLSQDNDTEEWRVSYDQNAQRDCEGVYSESAEQANNKSYQRNKDGQQDRKPGMGNTIRECDSCVCDGVGEQCGGKSSETQTNGCNCNTCKGDAQSGDDIQKNRGSIGIQKGGNQRLLYPQLAAREISIEDITEVTPFDCDIVYDLQVADNHNYCVTTDNIIAHNSGKTYLLGIKTYQLIRKFPKVRGFVGANTAMQLTQSTLFRIREYWKSIGIVEYDKEGSPLGQYVVGKKPPSHFSTEGHSFDSYYNIISFINGAIVFIGSLENSSAHSGKEAGWGVLDETWDTREEDVKEIIIARIRQRGMFMVNGELKAEGKPEEQYNPLFIVTSPAKVDWINELFSLETYIEEINNSIYSDKTFFWKEFDNKCVVISSTWHNVHNVGENYIRNVLDNNSDQRGKALIYACPFVSAGGEFYSSFDRLKHVGKCTYDKTKPLHISFDQNSVPYNSCSIWQFERKEDIWWSYCIDEIALENPRNSTEEVCEDILMRYASHKSAIYYYGDASGKARSTMNKEFKHHYEIIEYKLRRFLVNGSARMMRQNPSITKRRDFINRIFEEKLPIRILIDESCKLMIADMMYVKQDINGAKDKHIVTDKETGDKYQKYGHLSDTCFVGETLILTDKGEKRIDQIKFGDKVLTRAGFMPVIAFHNNGIKKVNTYVIGDKEIACTDDHKIFANNHFSMVKGLIGTNILCIFAEKETWKKKQLSTTTSDFTVTPMVSPQATGTTIRDGFVLMANGQSVIFTDTFGRRLMGRFQKDLQYTILMVTSEITELRTSLYYRIKSIWGGITKEVRMITNRCLKMSYSKKHIQRQLNGISRRRVGSGIRFTLRKFFSRTNMRLNVKDVGRSLKLYFGIPLNGVPENAKINIKHEDTGQRGNIMNSAPVLNVAEYLRSIDGVNLYVVPVLVEEKQEERNAVVYDITVDGMHEYFANGILVHNCEYQLVEVFNNYYK